MTHLLRIAARRALTPRIAEFRFDGAEGGFAPGAHVRLATPQGARAYSLIRFTPEDASWRIAVQHEPDGAGGSAFMHGLEVGAEIQAEAPQCDFPLNMDAPALFLAGGIGVTPIISMATALRAAGRDFTFHYAGRARDQMAYIAALEDAFGPALRAHFDDKAGGPLDIAAPIAAMDDATHLYVCGPRPMIDAARAAAEAAGIDRARIHFELFEAAAPESGDQPFEVEIASTGDVFTVPADKTIVETLEAAGVDLVHDCLRGDCGICQTDVVRGTPDHRDVVLSEEERASGKTIQICVSRAKSARLVLDL